MKQQFSDLIVIRKMDIMLLHGIRVVLLQIESLGAIA